MPYISVESGALTAEQKKELIERLTATAAEIIHIPAQFFTVTIKECKHPILGYHLSGERWRALAKKLCHKINDFYW